MKLLSICTLILSLAIMILAWQTQEILKHIEKIEILVHDLLLRQDGDERVSYIVSVNPAKRRITLVFPEEDYNENIKNMLQQSYLRPR